MLKVVSACLLLPLVLSLAAMLLLSIPSVQNSVVDMAAGFASEHLGARVAIDRISLGLVTRVKVSGFYVEDTEGDTMIYARTLNVRLGTLSDFRGGIRIPSARLEKGCCRIREMSSGVMNIKEVVSRLSRNKGKGKFSLVISDLSAEDLEFRLQTRRERDARGGVNYSDMRVFPISTEISDFTVRKSTIGGDIRRLSFVEQSGFEVDSMSGIMTIDKGLIRFDGLSIRTPRSHLGFSHLSLDGGDWRRFKYFVDSVRMEVRGDGCRIDSGDIAYFAPSLGKWGVAIPDVDVAFDGTVADMKASLRTSSLEGDGEMDVTARIKGLPDIRRSNLNVDVRKIRLRSREMSRLLASIAGMRVPEEVSSVSDTTGMIQMSGLFRGRIDDFEARASASLASGGGVTASCRMHREGEVSVIDATADVVSVDFGRILRSRSIGEGSLSAKAEGVVGKGNTDIRFSAMVHSLSLLGHRYNGTDVAGRFSTNGTDVDVRFADPALRATVKASLSGVGTGRRIGIAADVGQADLHAMNVNRRDSLSVLKGRIRGSVSGSCADDVNGLLSLEGMSYRCPFRTIEEKDVRVSMRNEAGVRLLSLRSDYLDADVESTGLFSEAMDYAGSIFRHYVPSFYGNVQSARKYGDGVTTVHVNAKNMTPLLECMAEEMDVAVGTTADVRLNPARNRFSMHVSSQFLNLGSILATEMTASAENESDSLKVEASTADFYIGTLKLSHVGLRCGVRADAADIAGEFSDSTTGSGGAIRMRALVSRIAGRRHMSLQVLPSGISRKDNAWQIQSEGIEIDSQHISIRRLNLRNGDQALYIDGVASRSVEDSLFLRMNRFSFAPLMGALKKIGYSVTGRGSGDVCVRAALSAARIEAGLRLSDFNMNGVRAPEMRLESRWDLERSRASLHIIAERSGDTIMRGFYSPQKVKYFVESRLDSLNMSLLDPILKGVVRDTEGKARVSIRLRGERRNAELAGSIDVDGLATTVDYTKCRYSVPKAHIDIRNNHLRLPATPMYDEGDGKGTLEMDLSLNHLSNIEYRLSAAFRQCRVFSTTARDNDLFYGNVIATGDVLVAGDKAGTHLLVNAATTGPSRFFMPLSEKGNIATADFIRFVKPQFRDTTDYLVRKKMMFERKMRPNRASRSEMDISLSLAVNDNTEIQLVVDPTVGDILKANGNGSLSIHVNPRRNVFEMFGDYTISGGSYLFTLQNIINKRFVINSGSMIQWTGEPLDALLNISATYKVRASLQPLLSGYMSEDNISSRLVPVYCNLFLTDRLTHPSVTFGIEIPEADSTTQSAVATVLTTPEDKAKQFVSLLMANTFVADTSNSSSIGGSTAANTGLEMLSNQLSNWLSTEDYSVILRYRSRTDKNTSDQMDFGISKGLINNRLLIELEGNYLFDKSQIVNAKSNFSGEAYVTWLIDKAGTLRLKGFTHTIDRFDENQGLQETGIGIAYREEFDNARDFKRRIKRRFSRKYREAMNSRMNARDSVAVKPSSDEKVEGKDKKTK